MAWHTLSKSKDVKVIGTYPQTDGMSPGYNLNSDYSIWNLQNLEPPNFEPNFDSFQLDRRAKLTDIISTSLITASGFILSDRVKNIFKTFNIPPHIYFPAIISYKKQFFKNYSWLHFTADNTIKIDFKNSSFILTHPLPFFRTDSILLTSKDKKYLDDIQRANPDYRLFAKKIKLNNSESIDLAFFDFLYHKYYVSDRLAQALNENSITGINLTWSEAAIEVF